MLDTVFERFLVLNAPSFLAAAARLLFFSVSASENEHSYFLSRDIVGEPGAELDLLESSTAQGQEEEVWLFLLKT